MIIELAPYSTLRAMRESSTAYREVVDKDLEHILVQEAPSGMARARRLEISSAAHQHLPPLAPLFVGNGTDADLDLQRILRIAQVVDFGSEVSVGGLGWLWRSCRNARVLRNMSPVLPHAPSVPSTPSPTSSTSTSAASISTSVSIPAATATTLISFTAFKTTVYAGIKRLILNLTFDPDSPSRAMQVLPLPASVRQVVFIVPVARVLQVPPPASPPRDENEDRSSARTTTIAQFNNVILQISNGLSQGAPRAEYTVVGVDGVDPGWFGLALDDRIDPHSLVVDTVRSRVRNLLVLAGTCGDDAAVDSAVGSITFTSHAAYAVAVGVRAYGLETRREEGYAA